MFFFFKLKIVCRKTIVKFSLVQFGYFMKMVLQYLINMYTVC